MKVVSELMTVALMDAVLLDAKRLVGLLEIGFRAGQVSDIDLLVAQNHVDAIERKIKIIKEESWDYYPALKSVEIA